MKDLSTFKKIEAETAQRNNIANFLEKSHRKFINELFYVDRQALFDDMLQGILRLTESEYGFIGEVIYKDSETPYLKTYALSNISWNKDTKELYDKYAASGMEFHNLKTLFGAALVTGRIVISNHPATDDRAGVLPKGHPPLNAFLGIPLGEKNNLIGMIGLANRKDGYSEEILHMMNPVWITAETMILAYRDFKKREKYTHELAQTEKLLLSEKSKLSNIIERTNLATWEWEVQSNNLIINKQWAEMIGYTIEELSPLSTQTWKGLTHPDDLKKAVSLLEQHFNGIIPNYDCEFRVKHKNGYWIWVHAKGQVSSWSNEGKPLVMFGIHENITDRKFVEQQAYHRANYDPVTELPSRRYAEETTLLLIQQSERNSKKLAVLYADLDNFKPVNDSYGHEIGDRLLKTVGDRFKASLRKADLVARIGGDEFFIILDNIDSVESVVETTEKIIKKVSEPYIIDKQVIHIGISIGVAIFPIHGNDSKSLIKLADNAMYLAKQKGKNQFYITDLLK